MKFCVNVSVVWRVCLQSISVGAEYQADLPDLITSTDPPGTCVIIDITISVVTVPKFSLTVGYGEFLMVFFVFFKMFLVGVWFDVLVKIFQKASSADLNQVSLLVSTDKIIDDVSTLWISQNSILLLMATFTHAHKYLTSLCPGLPG